MTSSLIIVHILILLLVIGIITFLIIWNLKSCKSCRKLKEEFKILERKNQELNNLSMTDTLTGLMNRRAIEPIIHSEINRTNRYNSPVSLLILDLDHFKQVNDNYGHDFGDKVLKHVAETIEGICRKTDSISRWGGEEFLVLAPDTTAANAVYLSEKIRRQIESSHVDNLDDLTVSIGASSLHRGESFQDWFNRTDTALYYAKDEGRNRVVGHPGDSVGRKSKGRNLNILHLEWKNRYSSGIDLIDEQHQELFHYANILIDTVLNNAGNEAVLDSLMVMLAIIKEHFKNEEATLLEYSFPKLKDHAQGHRKLVLRMNDLILLFQEGDVDSIELLNFIAQELIYSHLLNEDKGYFFINRRK